MTTQQLDFHVRVIGWLRIAEGFLCIVIGGFVLTFFSGIGVASGDPEAVRILGVIGLAVASFLMLLAVPVLITGYGLLKRRSWGRMLAVVVGVLDLLNFPLGTAIGIYSFWVLFDQDADAYFARPKPPAAELEAPA